MIASFRILALLAAIILVAPACGGGEELEPSGANQSDDSASTGPEPAPSPADDPQPTGRMQSSEDALTQDLALAAESRGWTIEEATAHYQAGEIAGPIAGRIAAERPHMFVGSALSPDPYGAPMIYIKGPADEFIRNLVAAAEIEIKIVDNQPFSRDELDERQLQVVRALQALGFQNLSAYSNFTGGIIAAVTLEPDLPSTVSEILALLPASLRDSVTLTVSNDPVVVDETYQQ